MRTNIVIWWLLAAFFFVLFAAYTAWSLLDPFHGYVEWAGTIALLFMSLMSGMIGFFISVSYKAQKGIELPEDREDVDVDDGDPEMGEFAPWSWWPLVLAAAPAVFVLGLATAHFLLPLAVFLLAISLVGWAFEYYRGHFAR